MALPNLKTIIIASCKPFIWALRCFYDSQVKYITALVLRQNEIITELQGTITELNAYIEKQNLLILGYKDEVFQINKTNYTSQQVDDMANRLRQLEMICSALYGKTYELIHTGTVVDPTLPDYNNPDLPKD